jgi:hypothetical protein
MPHFKKNIPQMPHFFQQLLTEKLWHLGIFFESVAFWEFMSQKMALWSKNLI